MNKFAVPQRTVAEWLCKIGTFFGLSLCWILCSLPVITIIPAGVALYDTVVKCPLGVDEHPFRRFFKDFKSELLRGIGLTLIWLVVAALYFFGLRFMLIAGESRPVLKICAMVYAGTILIPLSMLSWLIPLESRFALGFGGLHKMALTLSLVKLPRTAASIGMLIASVLIIFVMPVMMVLLPAIYSTLQAVVIENTLISCEEPEPEALEPGETEEAE